MLDFTRRLIALRAAHPVLRRQRFAHGDVRAPLSGFADIEWLREDGAAMRDTDWQDPDRRAVGLLLAEPLGADGLAHGEDTLLVIVNAGPRAVRFCLPDGSAFSGWLCSFATAPIPTGTMFEVDAQAHALYVLVPVR